MLRKLETELKIRGFSDKTVKIYLYITDKFLDNVKKDPSLISEDDIKLYIVHLMSNKKSKPSSINLTLSALRFFFNEIVESTVMAKIKSPKLEKKLPTVLNKFEIQKLLKTPKNIKHRLLLEFLYSTGTRISEAVSIKTDDIYFKEKIANVKGGKGKKDRVVILSERVVKSIISYLDKRKNKINPYLFDVKNSHMSVRMGQKIVNDTATKAKIRKRVFCHALRSSFATHLLENGTDIRLIQELLGHANLSTTERYTKVTTDQLKKVKSPLDNL